MSHTHEFIGDITRSSENISDCGNEYPFSPGYDQKAGGGSNATECPRKGSSLRAKRTAHIGLLPTLLQESQKQWWGWHTWQSRQLGRALLCWQGLDKKQTLPINTEKRETHSQTNTLSPLLTAAMKGSLQFLRTFQNIWTRTSLQSVWDVFILQVLENPKLRHITLSA